MRMHLGIARREEGGNEIKQYRCFSCVGGTVETDIDVLLAVSCSLKKFIVFRLKLLAHTIITHLFGVATRDACTRKRELVVTMSDTCI